MGQKNFEYHKYARFVHRIIERNLNFKILANYLEAVYAQNSEITGFWYMPIPGCYPNF